MAKLTIHNASLTPEEIEEKRQQRFLALPPRQKWDELMALIRLSVALNGGRPIKQPQGKGLVIYRKK